MNKLVAHLVWWMIWVLRKTCRVRFHDDPRPRLREQGQPYLMATLHGQQVAMLTRAEPGCGALVSRSKDGDLIAETVRRTGAIPIRGSAGKSRKGGATALRGLVNHVSAGNTACLAVDGPKGPRGVVNPGIALLSQKTGAPVLPIVAPARWRFVVAKSWDRTQLPLPWSRIDGGFGEPLFPREGESVAEFTARIQEALLALEREWDPREAAIAQSHFESQQDVTARQVERKAA